MVDDENGGKIPLNNIAILIITRVHKNIISKTLQNHLQIIKNTRKLTICHMNVLGGIL